MSGKTFDLSPHMKDAKVTTTTIPANEKLSLHAIRRAERLAVLEEVERKIGEAAPYVGSPEYYRGAEGMKKASLIIIRSMKEAAK